MPKVLAGRRILIAGSASRNVEAGKVRRAVGFVQLLARAILTAGGGLVVFGSNEPSSNEGVPLIFDWVILREVESLCHAKETSARVVVVTSNKARGKMTDEQRALLAKLSARGIADFVNIPDDVHTGGNIGDEEAARTNGMVAIGGGKGVADRASKLCRRGFPVLPFDLQIGALSEDGEGAIALHRAVSEAPERFFPHTAARVRAALPGLSLDAPVMDLSAIAERSVAVLGDELAAADASAPAGVLFLTALPIELAAMLEVLGCSEVPSGRGSAGINYWKAKVDRGDGSSHLVALASFGAAGNADAAAVTTALIADQQPCAVIMVGIAAGMRDKCALGDVVISERVVAYEGAAMMVGPKGARVVQRPETYRTSVPLMQDVTAYLASSDVLTNRLQTLYDAAGLAFPIEPGDEMQRRRRPLPRLVTIASGEKLLRDPEKFRALREGAWED